MLGELKSIVSRESLGSVVFLGKLSRDEVLANTKRCRFLVFPSEWYEGFPLTIVEAFACGTPIVASNLGAMREVIDDERTGLLFEPGDANDLVKKLRWAWGHPELMETYGRAGRREFESKYTAERNRDQLLAIYERVLLRRRTTNLSAG